MKDAEDDRTLPVLTEVPLEELLASEDWRLSRAASQVIQSLDHATYAAHSSSPDVSE
jgi:hypothetical protein